MNRVYPWAKDRLLAGQIDITSDDLRVQLVDDAAAYDAADDVLGDLGAVTVGTAVSIGTVTSDAGAVSALSPVVTVTDAPAAADVAGFVVYVESGSAPTRYLLAWIDTAADTTAISLTTTGDDIDVTLADPFIRL
ncbi:MAG TPA: hypothetical protein VGE43_19355 [Acidimicrobiales bacterium]